MNSFYWAFKIDTKYYFFANNFKTIENKISPVHIYWYSGNIFCSYTIKSVYSKANVCLNIGEPPINPSKFILDKKITVLKSIYKLQISENTVSK